MYYAIYFRFEISAKILNLITYSFEYWAQLF